MSTEVLQQDLHRFIQDTFLPFASMLEFDDTQTLVDLGILDSLAFVELVEHIQDQYGVEVRDVEITQENFGSVAALARYVISKRAT